MTLEDLLCGDKINVRYTFKTDDITKGAKPHGVPYIDRKAYFDEKGYAEEIKAKITVKDRKGGLKILLTSEDERLSEFGLSLPMNFMGKKNGGGWKNQYLFNSPYTSEGNLYKYCYLTNPNGKNLILFPKGKCDGWKLDYSDFACGHFFINLQFLASFDKAYGFGTKGENRKLELYVFEVENFEEGVNKVCETLAVPALTYEKSAVKLGEKIALTVRGECDRVRVGKEYYYPENGRVEIPAKKYGLTRAVPYKGKKRGMDAVFFAYKTIEELYCKAVSTACNATDRRYTDENMCEHQNWQTATYRYMQRYGKKRSWLAKLRKEVAILTERDATKAIPRRCIYYKPHAGRRAYFTFESFRIQELLFGVTILMEAYKTTGMKKCRDYMIRSLNGVLKHNFDNGMIFTDSFNGDKEDYTTVCCLIIPFVDAALLFKEEDPTLSEKYERAAAKIAEHLYARKGFHTEALYTDLTEEEMEDGSISCTALSLLYYSAKIKREEKYIRRAKEILDLHESWVTHSPIAPCFHSSLRWWETFWEGDKTGPSLCLGHGWTIWRAEADYWYYHLTGDGRYKEKAFNGFMSNFSKINARGQSYACWCADYIPGGGFTDDSSQVRFEIRQGLPEITDSGLSAYAWARAADSILNDDIF